MTTVLAPFAGTVVDLATCPDPVFAAALLGGGVGLVPAADGEVEVRSPVAGRVAAVHPHAAVVAAPSLEVLVHLGLDTVSLRGRGFDVRTAKGREVAAGDVLVRWDVAPAVDAGLALLSPVLVLQSAPRSVRVLPAAGSTVEVGTPLLEHDA